MNSHIQYAATHIPFSYPSCSVNNKSDSNLCFNCMIEFTVMTVARCCCITSYGSVRDQVILPVINHIVVTSFRFITHLHRTRKHFEILSSSM